MTNTVDKILPGFAGIDIGKETNFVGVEGEVRSFSTMTFGIKELAAFLTEHNVEHVCMEATGVYWVALHDHLDNAGFDVTLFNGAYARNLPGRKTDVKDCQWHGMLHSHGLLKGSFIPDDMIRQLRGAVRDRGNLLATKSQCLLQMQKALDLMNMRPHNVLSQLESVSGLAMIRAIIKGERDRERLVALCHVSIRNKKRKEMLRSLEGTWSEQHLFSLKLAYDHYQFVLGLLSECDSQIEKLLIAATKGMEKKESKAVTQTSHNTPKIGGLDDYLMTYSGGADLPTLTGIGSNLALKMIAETGVDLSRWETVKHFVAWATLAPGNHQSGKKRKRVSKRQKSRIGQLFREAAFCLSNSKNTALGAFYQRIKARRGAAVAMKATARKVAVAYYNLFTKGPEYVEQGRIKYEEQLLYNRMKYFQRKAKSMGFSLVNDETGEVLAGS